MKPEQFTKATGLITSYMGSIENAYLRKEEVIWEALAGTRNKDMASIHFLKVENTVGIINRESERKKLPFKSQI